MSEENIYGYIEPVIISLYLVFIFLAIQIWFMWNDIDKNESDIRSFFNDSFFRKNCIYVYSFSIFFIAHGFFESTTVPGIYIKTLELLTLVSLVLFTYDWYGILDTCTSKRALPRELTNFCYIFKRN